MRRWVLCRVGPLGIGLALLALSAGCAASPGYPSGEGKVSDAAALDDGDAIPYRSLSRADFKGRSLPEGASAYAKRIGALTCVRVMTTPETSLEVVETSPSGYEGRFERLGFHALMNRQCSWWNPEGSSMPESYVLQHEQIHFALTELEARRLHARAPNIVAEFVATGSSVDEVQAMVQARLEEIIQEALENLLEENRKFDEDTSAKYAPALQQKWFDRVSAELGKTGGG